MSVVTVPWDEGPRPVVSQPTPGPTAPEAFEAAFRQNNSVVSVLQNARGRGTFAPVDGYSAWNDIKDEPRYLEHAPFFAGSTSPAETQLLKGKIDQQEADRRTMAASGPLGIVASAAAGAIDPTMLLPGRIAIGVLKDGAPFVRGALQVGGAMAAQSAMQETALQASQQTRPLSESVMSVGSATILGAMLGGAAAWLSPAEHANLVKGLDRERAQADAHVTGSPETVAVVRVEPPAKVEPLANPTSPLEGLRPAYEAAKAEQGGISSIYISDLIARSGLPKEQVHDIIRDAARTGEVSINRSATAEGSLTPEQVAGTLHVSGDETPYHTVRFRPAEAIAPTREVQLAPASAGAAVTDTRTLDTLAIAPTGTGVERIGFDKAVRGLQRQSLAARRGFADLAELALMTKGNLKGEVATSGGAPLESIGRLQMNQTLVSIRDELAKQWQDLRFGSDVPSFALLRDKMGRFGGLGDRGDKPTFEEFKGMVSDAIQNDNKHDLPQVQIAAEKVSRDVFEKWGTRAEAAVEGFKRAEQKEGEGYFPHLWNKQQIAAFRPEFVNKLTAWYASEQTAKRAAQGRLQAYQGALDVHEASIKKLTGRLEKKQADLDEDEALRDEVSRINKFAFQRATTLRTAVDKNLDKARGGAVFETKVRERGNTLADRASAHAHEVEDLEEKLQNAHASAIEMRKKIEDELGRWEGKSAAEAKSAIKAREKYEAERDAARAAKGETKKLGRTAGADDAVDRAVKRILASDRDRPIEDLRDRANETVDRILSSPDGRLPYDEDTGTPDYGPSVPKPPVRGSLAERALDVSNAFARDWVERDIEKVVHNHLRTFVPDVLLSERFGDTEMSNVFRQINEEYSRLIDATGPGKERTALEKDRRGAIEDLAATRDMFRGLYNIPSTESGRRLGRISANLRNASVMLNMGMGMVSSIPDAAGAVFRMGMLNTFRDAYMPFFKSLATDRAYSKEVMRQFRVMGISIDTQNAARHHAISGISEEFVPHSPFERTLQWGADKMQLANLLGPWTDFVKTMTASVASAEIYRAAKASARGTATKKQTTRLAEANITPDLAMKIAEQYEKSGNRVDGVLLPNTEAWTNREAKQAFEAALTREANISVVTPGLDRPTWLSDPVLSVIGQFKSFTAAATTRIMIANLQRADAQTLQGLIASLGMGMISYKVNSLTGGSPTSDRPQDWIKEAMSRGNIFGWLEEGNALTSKMTRGRVDAYRLMGADKPLSRFAGRTVMDQLMGPTFGKAESLAKITGAAASGDWNAGDVTAFRRFIAGQNLPYIRGLLNQVEAGVDNAFGIPHKQ